MKIKRNKLIRHCRYKSVKADDENDKERVT